VPQRVKDLSGFWKSDVLSPLSNGVFGEGGAGTFSDGKLTTRTNSLYHRFVHETLVECGAPEVILFSLLPHHNILTSSQHPHLTTTSSPHHNIVTSPQHSHHIKTSSPYHNTLTTTLTTRISSTSLGHISGQTN